MKLEDLGYHKELEELRIEKGLDSFDVARVSAEHKDRYHVMNADGEFEAEVIGNLRFTAKSRADFPVVGDWVAVTAYDTDKMIIHSLYPRTSLLERQAVGKQGEKQPIASNVDIAWIVQAVDRDFNINRLERYLSLCHDAKIHPVIILSKTDLIDSETLEDYKTQIAKRLKDTLVIPVSNITSGGCNELIRQISKAKTYCLLGSSGAGKSSLLNTLAGKELMPTSTISEANNKGRHTTTHRQVHILDNGGIFVDNPGIREVGIADSEEGLEQTFQAIAEWAKSCRYADCTHTQEEGCAVLEAMENGELDEASYDNYVRLEKEREHFSMTKLEKRRKDKDFGKFLKDFKKNKKNISNKHDK